MRWPWGLRDLAAFPGAHSDPSYPSAGFPRTCTSCYPRRKSQRILADPAPVHRIVPAGAEMIKLQVAVPFPRLELEAVAVARRRFAQDVAERIIRDRLVEHVAVLVDDLPNRAGQVGQVP